VSISYAELSQRKRQRNGNGGHNAPQAERGSASASVQPTYANKIELVQTMEGFAFSGEWERFKSFLASDIYYRVGNSTEVRGAQAVVEYLKKMLATELAINDLKIRSAWEAGNTVILELNMAGLRIRDNKQISYPCVDVYRFDGDKIRDWRVYAIEPTFIV
jgi:predicted SnoaL-like aldol condensation-catalyzing enzyme